METPICDFVTKYANKKTARFHMPGHKGNGILGCEHLDITEISGADDLSNPHGIILESEKNATQLFNTRHTFYSVGGSSQSIKSMLNLAKLYSKNNSKTIIAARNSHKAFFHACALLDLQPIWMYTNSEAASYYSFNINAADLNNMLSKCIEMPIAVFVTSPDYLGNVLNIQELSDVCNNYGIPLLVDNAHGAYFSFLQNNKYKHPIDCGADICCDSAHKTLPVITGGAYLHINKNAQHSFEKSANVALSYFGSSSPSYLVLQSLDKCNELLKNGYAKNINDFAEFIFTIKNKLKKLNMDILESDPLRIVISANKKRYTGHELNKILSENNIECEYSDDFFVVLMITPQLEQHYFFNLLNVCTNINHDDFQCNDLLNFNYVQCEIVLSPREAMMSKYETLLLDECVGRICATPTVSCPPAVPIVLGGELINKESYKLLKHFNVVHLDVIK